MCDLGLRNKPGGFDQQGCASVKHEVHENDGRNASTKCGLPRCSKWAGIGSCDDRRNVRVGILRKSGKGSLHLSGLRWSDQLLHKGESLARRVEGRYRGDGEPCRDGGPRAGDHRDLSLGIPLTIGLLTRPLAFVASLYLASLWISEWGATWIWELLVPVCAPLRKRSLSPLAVLFMRHLNEDTPRSSRW